MVTAHDGAGHWLALYASNPGPESRTGISGPSMHVSRSSPHASIHSIPCCHFVRGLYWQTQYAGRRRLRSRQTRPDCALPLRIVAYLTAIHHPNNPADIPSDTHLRVPRKSRLGCTCANATRQGGVYPTAPFRVI